MLHRDSHHRRSIRLQGYDYSQAGAYFVTICTQGKEYLFGGIENGEVASNEYGCVVRDEWLKTAEIRTEIQTGEFVVMPNHFYGIVIIDSDAAAIRSTEIRFIASHRSGIQIGCHQTHQ